MPKEEIADQVLVLLLAPGSLLQMMHYPIDTSSKMKKRKSNPVFAKFEKWRISYVVLPLNTYLVFARCICSSALAIVRAGHISPFARASARTVVFSFQSAGTFHLQYVGSITATHKHGKQLMSDSWRFQHWLTAKKMQIISTHRQIHHGGRYKELKRIFARDKPARNCACQPMTVSL